MDWEKDALHAEKRNSHLGLWFGFAALIILTAGAIICTITGHDVIAGFFVGTTALGLIPAFIRGRGLFNWIGDSDASGQEQDDTTGQEKKVTPRKASSRKSSAT